MSNRSSFNSVGRIPAELQPAINSMTNHQRNRWAAAGYPIDDIGRYAPKFAAPTSVLPTKKVRKPRVKKVSPQ